ncbi:hypothetical protein DCMF_10720 [Candidatus Formimonas warabiya]|uniref:Uncharacterized protein n=1 Tax=Formimonas warabiya TaxID=1761012 RepID=A0A3G1KRT0_FORW1|nr:hypothetical protein DCMF_10720 [Candidatus Formimonas warabiya]
MLYLCYFFYIFKTKNRFFSGKTSPALKKRAQGLLKNIFLEILTLIDESLKFNWVGSLNDEKDQHLAGFCPVSNTG